MKNLLQLAPIPIKHTVKENTEDSGNPTCLWVVERDTTPNIQTAKEAARYGKNATTLKYEQDRSNTGLPILETAQANGKLQAVVEANNNPIDPTAAQNASSGKPASDKKPPAGAAAAIPKQNSNTTDPVKDPKASSRAGIQGQKRKSENGFSFARRKDVEDCSS